MKKTAIMVVVLVLMVMSGGVLLSQRVSEESQAMMVFKILPYDRNFERFGDPVRIGVTSDLMLNALKKESPQTLRGKTIVVEKLKAVADISNFSIIFVDRDWSKNYGVACAKASEHKVLMFCGSYNAAEKDEAAIAFREIQDKVRIVLNLKVSKDQGTDFPSDLLKLSIVVGNI